MNLRRSTRRMTRASSLPSGSEYGASEKSVDMDEQPDGEEPKAEEPPEEVITTRRRRLAKKKKYMESSDNDGEGEADIDVEKLVQDMLNYTRQRMVWGEDDEDDSLSRRLTMGDRLKGFIASDDENARDGFFGPRRKKTKPDALPIPELRPFPDVAEFRLWCSTIVNATSNPPVLTPTLDRYVAQTRWLLKNTPPSIIQEAASRTDCSIWSSDKDFIMFRFGMPMETTERVRAAWTVAGRNPTKAAAFLADPTWSPGSSAESGNVDQNKEVDNVLQPPRMSEGKGKRTYAYRPALDTKASPPPVINDVANAPIEGPFNVDSISSGKDTTVPGLTLFKLKAAVGNETNSLKRTASSSRYSEEDTEQQHADADGNQRTRRLRKKLRWVDSSEESGNEEEEGNKEEEEDSEDSDEEKKEKHNKEQDESSDEELDPNVLTVEPSARHSTRTTLSQSNIEDEDEDADDDYDDQPSSRNGSTAEDVEDDSYDALSYVSEPEPEPEQEELGAAAQVAGAAPMSRKEQIQYLTDLKRQREEQEQRD